MDDGSTLVDILLGREIDRIAWEDADLFDPPSWMDFEDDEYFSKEL